MIERVVHRIWIDGEEPGWTRPFAATWERPGWRLCQWDGPGALFPLRNQAIYDAAEEIAPLHVGQLRSDVLRYEILLRYGGVYVDVDFECRRPIDELLADNVDCFAAWEEPGAWLNQAILGATPNHPLLEALVDGLAANVASHQRRKRWYTRPAVMSGPQFFTRVAREMDWPLTRFPRSFFYPYLWSEVDEHGPSKPTQYPDAYAVHHWHNARRERGIPA